MVPAITIEDGDASFEHIRSAITIYETAAGAISNIAETGVGFGFQGVHSFRTCHISNV